jgi:putative helicase MOV10L1
LPSWARGTAASKSYNNHDYDALGFTDDLALEDANDFDAIAEAIARTAELSLLGVGATDALGDADVFSFDDFGDEPAWRVSI